jgi:AcrR family transcriptional regulator
MVKSASGVRERHQRETERLLTELARRLTAENGLSGFTIEGLCEAADISRRTFFNYFASKEDAVVGVPVKRDDSILDLQFVEGGKRKDSSLVDDFASLIVARWQLLGITPESAREFFAALDREPKLLARFVNLSREHERADIVLVEVREGLAPGDPRASTLVHLMGALLRVSAEELLSSTSGGSFQLIFERRLAAARELLSR